MSQHLRQWWVRGRWSRGRVEYLEPFWEELSLEESQDVIPWEEMSPLEDTEEGTGGLSRRFHRLTKREVRDKADRKGEKREGGGESPAFASHSRASESHF
jgi:hypothetical protein